jgi:serine protease
MMRGLVRILLAASAAMALAAFALVGTAVAAPGGIPGPPDQPGGGQPPVAGVVRPLTNGESSSAGRPSGGSKTNNLKYGGGQVETSTRVFVVFWGSQWSTTGDPAGVATYLTKFLGGLFGSQDHWSTSTTQYCQGAPNGTTSCPVGAIFIGHPTASPLAGTWIDNATAAPSGASQSQLAAEARRAAAHFSTTALGSNTQIVVATPSGAKPQGFGTSYCAWHSYTSGAGIGTIAYTNLPYMPDAGAACGQGFVNAGAAGALDGVSIVGGHEYAETVTDPFLNAWRDQQGQENGDKCAWISPTQPGGARNLALGSPSVNYAVQGLWSNALNNGTGGCVNTT